MSSLAGKVALVTGGSKGTLPVAVLPLDRTGCRANTPIGIGAAVVKHLAARGASVVINFSSDATAAENTLSSLPASTNSSLIKADVSKPSECQRLVDETIQKHGRLDILILNAGILPNVSIEQTTEDVYDRTFAVNVKGPYFLAQAALKHLPQDGTGRIIFFSSTLTVLSSIAPNYTLYVATKGAIEQLTRALAKDMGKRNILVNCVSPGPIGTELFYEGKSEQMVKMVSGLSPQGRIGTPEEVAEVVGFLSGPESRWVMGQNIRINGGTAV